MKLSKNHWCKIQQFFANLKCPRCFSAKVDLTENEGDNAECKDCGCTFEFDPEYMITHD